MDKNRSFLMSRAAGFLTLLACLLLIYLSYTLFRYLPPEGEALTPSARVMNYAGMILGGLLCPLFLPLPFADNPSRREKPIALSAARLLAALSSGLMITVSDGLFFLVWRRSASERGTWRAVPLFYALAVIAAGFCVFAAASVWLFRAAAPPAITLFIFMTSMTFFSEYPRFVDAMIVSLANLTLWFLFAALIAEACQKASRFYLCSAPIFISACFAVFGNILGRAVSGGAGFTALVTASETAVFLFLALPLLFQKRFRFRRRKEARRCCQKLCSLKTSTGGGGYQNQTF